MPTVISLPKTKTHGGWNRDPGSTTVSSHKRSATTHGVHPRRTNTQQPETKRMMPLITFTAPQDTTAHTAYVTGMWLSNMVHCMAHWSLEEVNKWPGEPIHLMLVPLPVIATDHPQGTVVINNMHKECPTIMELMGEHSQYSRLHVCWHVTPPALVQDARTQYLYFSYVETAREAVAGLSDIAITYVLEGVYEPLKRNCSSSHTYVQQVMSNMPWTMLAHDTKPLWSQTLHTEDKYSQSSQMLQL